jgi:hypothetical protein
VKSPKVSSDSVAGHSLDSDVENQSQVKSHKKTRVGHEGRRARYSLSSAGFYGHMPPIDRAMIMAKTARGNR